MSSPASARSFADALCLAVFGPAAAPPSTDAVGGGVPCDPSWPGAGGGAESNPSTATAHR